MSTTGRRRRSAPATDVAIRGRLPAGGKENGYRVTRAERRRAADGEADRTSSARPGSGDAYRVERVEETIRELSNRVQELVHRWEAAATAKPEKPRSSEAAAIVEALIRQRRDMAERLSPRSGEPALGRIRRSRDRPPAETRGEGVHLEEWRRLSWILLNRLARSRPPLADDPETASGVRRALVTLVSSERVMAGRLAALLGVRRGVPSREEGGSGRGASRRAAP